MTIDYFLLVGSLLILLSAAIAKFSENIGVPSLLLFLGIGILAGPEGLVGIDIADPGIAQSIGILALVYILFAGGLDTTWSQVRPQIGSAFTLATLGVLLTALLIGLVATATLGFSLPAGLLLGAIISSTDAAAVFSVLRSRNVSLRGGLKHLLELESGSNDPMAVFLTIVCIRLMTIPDTSALTMVWLFILQMGLGGLAGFACGHLMVHSINRLKSVYEGIYPVFALAFVAFTYGLTAVLGGNGFLAVYAAGLVVGNSQVVQRRSLLRFFDGLAWLSQIVMFLYLGLHVLPSRLWAVLGTGILLASFLILIARPVSVFACLVFTKFTVREKALVSWVGLRGAVPIILATFPLLAGIPQAELMFSLVFFIVLTSALIQGLSTPAAARFLRVDAPPERRHRSPLEFAPVEGVDTDLLEFMVPFNAVVAGRPIVELGLPQDSLIVLVTRNEEFIVPSGGTMLEEGDTLLVLVNTKNLPRVQEILGRVSDSASERGP